MSYLVTGAAGFIGSHVVEELLNQNQKVLGIDAMHDDSYSKEIKFDNLVAARCNKNFTFLQIDLLDSNLIEFLEGIEYVIHLAAMPGLTKSWENPQLYIDQNISATLNLLQSLNIRKLKKFTYASTSSVYGSKVRPEMLNQNLNPVSPYGVTKLAAEHLLQSYMSARGLPLIVLRLFSVYGPRQRPDMGFHKLIDSIMKNRTFIRYGDGTQERTNTYVKDVSRVVVEATLNCKSGDVLNVSGQEQVSFNRVIQLIEQKLNAKARVLEADEREGEQETTDGRFSSVWDSLKLEPHYNLNYGLSKQIDWHIQKLELLGETQ